MAQQRRTLLRWLLGGGFTASIASFVYPAIRFMNPPDTPEASVNEVAAGKVQEFKPNTGKIVKFGSRPALLVRSGENEWKAFSAVCTHLNCTVQYPRSHAADLVRLPQRRLRPQRQGGVRPSAGSARRVRGQGARRRSGDFPPRLRSVDGCCHRTQSEQADPAGSKNGSASVPSANSWRTRPCPCIPPPSGITSAASRCFCSPSR